MAFLSNLRPASFRGVSFEVSSTKLQVGRRVQVFEYPQRDVPFVEDLGRSARTVTIEAVVTGDDYISRMKKIIAACEKEGSGKYVDPWLGSMTVTPKSTSAPVFDSIRVAKITITFVESGELRFPNSLLDTGSICQKLARVLQNAVFENFVNKFDLSKAQDFVRENVGEKFTDFISLDSVKSIGDVFDLAEDLSDLASDALTLIEGGPKVLAGRVMDTLGLAGYVSVVCSWNNVAKRISRLTQSSDFATKEETPLAVETTAKTTAESKNAVQELIRGVMVANAVTASTMVGTDYDRVDAGAATRTAAYEDMIDVRDEVLAALDAEMLQTDSDDVYSALEQARAAVYEDMTTRAENRARLIDYTPADVMPALVLAYDYYTDASRDVEIIERNGIRHGGFVPAVALKMLNE